LISCSTEVTVEICRQQQQVATRYKNLNWQKNRNSKKLITNIRPGIDGRM
jgi:hypothetical protein